MFLCLAWDRSVKLCSSNEDCFNRYESDYQPQCIELSKEYIQDINSGGISSEGLLEQLEDRNDEDYSEYLEILEDTTADVALEQSGVIEALANDTRLISHVVPEQDTEQEDTAQQDLDGYVHQVKSKYRKIRPKRMKINHSATKASNATTNPSTINNTSSSALDTNAAGNSIFLTSSLMPDESTKVVTNSKDNDGNLEQIYLAPESKSSIELFFDSMAQTVKKLPPKAQADIKMNICKIVTEAEVRYSAQNVPQSTRQFITPPGMIPKLVLIPCDMIDNQNGKDWSYNWPSLILFIVMRSGKRIWHLAVQKVWSYINRSFSWNLESWKIYCHVLVYV